MNRDEALQKLEKIMLYKGNSPHTLKMYCFYLNKLFDFVSLEDVSLITVEHCMDHVIFLKNQGNYSPASLNTIIASYRYFFEVILDRPLTQRQLPSLFLSPKDPEIFTAEQINLLLQHASLKVKSMIILGFDCGLRVNEVAKLKCSDIDSDKMLLHINESKRRKSRTVKLSPLALETLRLYWKSYHPGNGYLYPSRRDLGYVNPSTINYYFRCLLSDAGLDGHKFRFHSLRHTYATMMLKHGCDPFLLRKLLGHSSFASTARYINMDVSDIASSFSLSDKMEVI